MLESKMRMRNHRATPPPTPLQLSQPHHQEHGEDLSSGGSQAEPAPAAAGSGGSRQLASSGQGKKQPHLPPGSSRKLCARAMHSALLNWGCIFT